MMNDAPQDKVNTREQQPTANNNSKTTKMEYHKE